MLILNHEQGTPEWRQSRVGIPTASCFDRIITTKGESSTQRTKYLYQLAGERLLGGSEETYQSFAMARGTNLEPEARSYFEFVQGVEVEQVGLCLTDDRLYGASPDGFINNRQEGIEIKCPSLAVHVEYLTKNKLPTEYFQQVQGSMLVTGVKAWWFLSYYPGLQPLILRVEQNEEFTSKLHSELISFCAELDALTTKLKERC